MQTMLQVVACICLKERRVEMYDSLGGADSALAQVLLRIALDLEEKLSHMTPERHQREPPKVGTSAYSPQSCYQHNVLT